MNLINFKFKKNNREIINKKNLKSIKLGNKTTFILDGIKYIYNNNNFIKSTKEEIITINIEKQICTIELKTQKLTLTLNINVIESKKIDNIISIKYNIETEENVINTIIIEYIKNS